MPLSLVRIDDRLIHGQVVEGWIPHLKAQVVLVVSDAAAADELQGSLMRLALPDDIQLEVLPVSAAARHEALKPDFAKRVLVLAPGPLEVLQLAELGAPFSRVNVGGLHYTAGKVQLGKAIYLSEQDRQALIGLSRRGIRLEGRALPNEKETDLMDVLGAAEGHA
jgi:mannose/fructose/N-acetylgalactosamine-specific phosphotransferase system component IIB